MRWLGILWLSLKLTLVAKLVHLSPTLAPLCNPEADCEAWAVKAGRLAAGNSLRTGTFAHTFSGVYKQCMLALANLASDFSARCGQIAFCYAYLMTHPLC